MIIHVDHRRELLEEIARAYETVFPARAAAALEMVRQARAGVLPGGMSRDGTMQWRLRIPTDLWFFIRRYIPDFGNDWRDWSLLESVWEALKVQ